ncbi:MULTISPECIES: formate/nitrite transporter family protein [unclassified Haladaptatus]|uniref:formate/nitrite transporter family protein n=1 Tax=unclassified Haladaptatus TaxID=2622732 RepID=UPI002FCE52EA
MSGEPSAGEEPVTAQTSSKTILSRQIDEGLNELTRPRTGLFLSALSAGLDIGFGPLLMAVIITMAGDVWSEPLLHLALANAYAVGFIFVVLGRSELFTEHTTLAVLPVLNRDATLAQLGRLWGIVYAGNIIGGIVFAAIAVTAAPSYGIADAAAFVEISGKLTEHSTWGLFTAAILAGWLMGLLSWLVAAAQETISRVFFVWLVTVTIGMAGLPHSIAGNVEVLAGLFLVPELGVLDYLHFLVLATVGNAIGGAVFVSLLKYGHVVRGAK